MRLPCDQDQKGFFALTPEPIRRIGDDVGLCKQLLLEPVVASPLQPYLVRLRLKQEPGGVSIGEFGSDSDGRNAAGGRTCISTGTSSLASALATEATVL